MHIGNDLLQNLQTLTFEFATFEASLADLGEVYNRFVLKRLAWICMDITMSLVSLFFFAGGAIEIATKRSFRRKSRFVNGGVDMERKEV
jgi:hypothetical protein